MAVKRDASIAAPPHLLPPAWVVPAVQIRSFMMIWEGFPLSWGALPREAADPDRGPFQE